MTTEKKYYVIREGKKIWIFDAWTEVQPLVSWFSGAKYKAFASRAAAEDALQQGREPYYQAQPKKHIWKSRDELATLPFVKESIAVDAACSGNPGVLEYRGVDLQTGTEIFAQRFDIWTNNIGEFLAIVHWLVYCKDTSLTCSKGESVAIYSDSKTAMSRVKQGVCRSKFRVTYSERVVRSAVKRAEEWLAKNGIPFQLLKWQTSEWGEIPADFGRK